MMPELTVLVLAGLLQVVQMGIGAVTMTRQHGRDYNASPRDANLPLTGLAGRADRALKNHYESLPLFAIGVLAITLLDKGTGLSEWLAWTYLAARIFYVPAYLMGLSPWRSLIWMVGFVATILLLLLAFI